VRRHYRLLTTCPSAARARGRLVQHVGAEGHGGKAGACRGLRRRVVVPGVADGDGRGDLRAAHHNGVAVDGRFGIDVMMVGAGDLEPLQRAVFRGEACAWVNWRRIAPPSTFIEA